MKIIKILRIVCITLLVGACTQVGLVDVEPSNNEMIIQKLLEMGKIDLAVMANADPIPQAVITKIKRGGSGLITFGDKVIFRNDSLIVQNNIYGDISFLQYGGVVSYGLAWADEGQSVVVGNHSKTNDNFFTDQLFKPSYPNQKFEIGGPLKYFNFTRGKKYNMKCYLLMSTLGILDSFEAEVLIPDASGGGGSIIDKGPNYYNKNLNTLTAQLGRPLFDKISETYNSGPKVSTQFFYNPDLTISKIEVLGGFARTNGSTDNDKMTYTFTYNANKKITKVNARTAISSGFSASNSASRDYAIAYDANGFVSTITGVGFNTSYFSNGSKASYDVSIQISYTYNKADKFGNLSVATRTSISLNGSGASTYKNFFSSEKPNAFGVNVVSSSVGEYCFESRSSLTDFTPCSTVTKTLSDGVLDDNTFNGITYLDANNALIILEFLTRKDNGSTAMDSYDGPYSLRTLFDKNFNGSPRRFNSPKPTNIVRDSRGFITSFDAIESTAKLTYKN